MPITAILFDVDGTLVDSNELHADAWVEAFAAKGHDVDRDTIRGQIGKGGDTLVPSLIPRISDEEREALSEAHGQAFKNGRLEQVRPFPQAHDLLARVHDVGLKIAIASSAKQDELDHYLGLLDAKALVDASVTKDDVERSKPHGDIVATALRKLRVGPEEALFVGDTPYDIESGAKCGVGTVALLSGGFDREALNGAKAVYADTAELLAKFPEWVRE